VVVRAASSGACCCLAGWELTGFDLLPFAAYIVIVLATSRERCA